MTINEEQQAGYITLKEASERFGYSPDYVGQLIRKGKIEGKQVYSNLAWMTTSNSIEEYLSREKHAAKPDKSDGKAAMADRFAEYLLSPDGALYLSWGLKGLMVLLVIVAMFVFYFLSIALDHKMVKDAERRLVERQLATPLSAGKEVTDHITYEE